ncbi:MAG: sigma-54 dependent transcriptional regulator [Thermoguttaceae bacterium]|jgi:Nif-specific regulatory protein
MATSLAEPMRETPTDNFHADPVIGSSPAMCEVRLRIQQVATTHTTVLIRGEAGTGKELVASAIHAYGLLAGRPLVKVHCDSLGEDLLESDLFGHAEGAFSGALSGHAGRVEEAEGGTLFLDEIGSFSPAVQVKLLRIIQEGEFERVGSNQPRKANVRVIAATGRDLEAAVESGMFRQDLFYHVSVFPIFLPPLRQRRDDILPLVEYFLGMYSQKMGKMVHRISTTAINMMLAYDWPGNVRQLENAVEHAVLLSRDGVIHSHNLPPALQAPEAKAAAAMGTLKARVAILERDMITEALRSCGGNVRAAAEQLGITPRIARYKMKKLGIEGRQ